LIASLADVSRDLSASAEDEGTKAAIDIRTKQKIINANTKIQTRLKLGVRSTVFSGGALAPPECIRLPG